MKDEGQASGGPALYLVATPIGNLEDITLRALRVLKEVDVIACEDTRQTQKLLNHYAIATRTTSYHEHNEMTKSAELVKEMQEGASVALVTDAGMPGISDPGYRLIALAIRHRVPVVPVPGASAFLAALVASGLPTDSFRFSGFLPAKRGERRAALEAIKSSPRTQVFYEAPHRVVESLEDVCEVLGLAEKCSGRTRSDQAARRIFARPRGRSVGEFKGARNRKGRDHVADREGGGRRCSCSGGRLVRPDFCPAEDRANHGGRESGRESCAKEGGEGAGCVEERGVPGVAEKQVRQTWLSDDVLSSSVFFPTCSFFAPVMRGSVFVVDDRHVP